MLTTSGTDGATLLSGDRSARRFDLVFVEAGFGLVAAGEYAEEVRRLCRELLGTQPFGRLRGLLNLFRVDPAADGCADLDVTTALEDERLLTVADDRAIAVGAAAVPSVDLVVVVVNTRRYGGSATRVAVTTRHPLGAALLVHEIGHAAFDLADEYGQGGQHHPGPEPTRVNVTLERDPVRCKWADLVDGSGSVGCFEGADRYEYGAFRPQQTCRMRSLQAPFCGVCARAISRLLLARASQDRRPR